MGGGAGRGEFRPRQPVCRHRRKRLRTKPVDPVGARHGGVRPGGGAPSAGMPSWSTDTISGRCWTALAEARNTRGCPTVILARTVKGKGVSLIEGRDGWHGKPVPKGAELDRAVAAIEQRLVAGTPTPPIPPPPARAAQAPSTPLPAPDPAYNLGDMVATRVAYGTALAALGAADPARRGAGRRRRQLHVQSDVREPASRAVLPDLHRGAGDAGRRGRPGQPRGHPVSIQLRLLPHARVRFHPHVRHRRDIGEHQAGRLPRRHFHRRGRTVADGAGRPGHDARGARLRGAVPVRRRQLRAAGCGGRGASGHGGTSARAARRPK